MLKSNNLIGISIVARKSESSWVWSAASVLKRDRSRRKGHAISLISVSRRRLIPESALRDVNEYWLPSDGEGPCVEKNRISRPQASDSKWGIKRNDPQLSVMNKNYNYVSRPRSLQEKKEVNQSRVRTRVTWILGLSFLERSTLSSVSPSDFLIYRILFSIRRI